MSNKYIQRGFNPEWPKEVQVWQVGEELPSWMSDHLRIKSIGDNGELIPMTRPTSEGGTEFIGVDGISIFLRTKSESDIVVYGDGRVLSISKRGFSLLYKEKEGK